MSRKIISKEIIYECTFHHADGTALVQEISWDAIHQCAKDWNFLITNIDTVAKIIELVENKRAANFRKIELKSCATCKHVNGFDINSLGSMVTGCEKHMVNGHDNNIDNLCDDWKMK